jgi:Fe2+ or Zn2+ uptake regulation protein
MSQEEVYKILKELGGEATTREIRERAKEQFPDLSLYQYVGDRLRKLEKNGYIVRILDNKGKIHWRIIQEYP